MLMLWKCITVGNLIKSSVDTRDLPICYDLTKIFSFNNEIYLISNIENVNLFFNYQILYNLLVISDKQSIVFLIDEFDR